MKIQSNHSSLAVLLALVVSCQGPRYGQVEQTWSWNPDAFEEGGELQVTLGGPGFDGKMAAVELATWDGDPSRDPRMGRSVEYLTAQLPITMTAPLGESPFPGGRVGASGRVVIVGDPCLWIGTIDSDLGAGFGQLDNLMVAMNPLPGPSGQPTAAEDIRNVIENPGAVFDGQTWDHKPEFEPPSVSGYVGFFEVENVVEMEDLHLGVTKTFDVQVSDDHAELDRIWLWVEEEDELVTEKTHPSEFTHGLHASYDDSPTPIVNPQGGYTYPIVLAKGKEELLFAKDELLRLYVLIRYQGQGGARYKLFSATSLLEANSEADDGGSMDFSTTEGEFTVGPQGEPDGSTDSQLNLNQDDGLNQVDVELPEISAVP